MVGRIEGRVVVLGFDVELGGHFELFTFPAVAFVLEAAEFSGILFAAAMQAGFLKLEIAQLLFIGEEGLKLDEARAERRVVVVESIRKLDTATSEDGEFEAGNAIETPGGVGQRLDERAFARRRGLKFLFEVAEVLLVLGGIVGGEQDGAAGQRRCNRIQ